MAECSTPFGIMEFRRAPDHPGPRTSPRAQRLSASPSFAGSISSVAQSAALNAQRLSASRSFAVACCCGSIFGTMGAQHLSASRSLADDLAPTARYLVEVLNAYRHHGVSRGSRPMPSGSPSTSAQRLSSRATVNEIFVRELGGARPAHLCIRIDCPLAFSDLL